MRFSAPTVCGTAHRRARTLSVLAAAALTAAVGGCKGSSDDSSAGAPRQFGPPSADQVRPGVEIRARDSSCTANYLFFLNADTYYIGTAAHCFSPDTNRGIDPCETRNEHHGFDGITIENATRPGVLVYSSWNAMQQQGEQPGSDTCRFNDFALVRIAAADLDNIHPSAILFGGPTSLQGGTAPVGDEVYTYGRSPFHGGVEDLEGKQGAITAVQGGGWRYRIATDNPGLPGDSGSPVLHQSGAALGVLTDVGVSTTGGTVTHGVTHLGKALDYAKRAGFIHPDVRLATSDDFSP